MAEDSSQERTEEPSDRRKKQYRDEGNVAVSRDIGSLAVVATGLAALAGSLGSTGGEFVEASSRLLGSIHLWTSAGPHDPTLAVRALCRTSLPVLLVPLAAVLVAGVGVNLLQTGWLWTAKPLMPKGSRIDPISRFKQMFLSIKTFSELLKSVAKLVVVGAVAYYAVDAEFERARSWIGLTPAGLVAEILGAMLRVSATLLAALIPVAAADFLFARWDHGRQLKMTKQEVKEEFKEREGDPHIKAYRRRKARELSQNRMIREVAEADLVVTNPTHLAVALRYRKEKESAPRVVARGSGRTAERIRNEARKHLIPVLEEKPLARALYKSTRVGQLIPPQLYAAVAELLAFVYRLREGRRRGGMP